MKTFYLLSLTFLIASAIFIYSTLNYVDVTKGCLVKISHDMLRGGRTSIRKALAEIKKTDPALYNNICSYVDIIYERRCLVVGDVYPSVRTLDSDGCYIAGTKIIYINPISDSEQNSVELRKIAITKYTSLATTYWNGVNTKQSDLDIF